MWGWLTPYARYALAPLTVFALLTGVRLARFWRTASRITQASLAAASLWVLIPALCATMIIEINAPQLRYAAGRISREDYLNQVLNTYSSLAWLRDHTTPDERILGLDNCSDIYAPPFPQYRSNCAFGALTEPEVARQLAAGSFDWLLAHCAWLPRGGNVSSGSSLLRLRRDLFRLDGVTAELLPHRRQHPRSKRVLLARSEPHH